MSLRSIVAFGLHSVDELYRDTIGYIYGAFASKPAFLVYNDCVMSVGSMPPSGDIL